MQQNRGHYIRKKIIDIYIDDIENLEDLIGVVFIDEERILK